MHLAQGLVQQNEIFNYTLDIPYFIVKLKFMKIVIAPLLATVLLVSCTQKAQEPTKQKPTDTINSTEKHDLAIPSVQTPSAPSSDF